ncbi:MAG: M12 family metallopeptidase [Thermoanaerobaculia bacterium]|nr:M12 family metallopeptidase [Thermoanaerobaculia bacterium]
MLSQAFFRLVLWGPLMIIAFGTGHAQEPPEEAFPEMQMGIGSPVEFEVVVDGETKRLTFVENDDGDAIYQGDIVLGKAVDLASVSSGTVSLQSLGRIELFGLVVRGDEARWPLGRLRYRLDPSLLNPARVRGAIAHWEKVTDITFEEIDDTSGAFVTFANGSGCSSALGMKGDEQQVRLAPGCGFGQVVHEIGHALGLHHEHARSDRDQFVRIHKNNILKGREFNFEPDPIRFADSGPYCYQSIMHYGPFAFSKQSSQATIEPVDQADIGQRDALAQCDIDTVSRLYAQELTKRSDATQPEGSNLANPAGSR